MSVQICENAVFSQIVMYLSRPYHGINGFDFSWCVRPLKDAGYDVSNTKGRKKVAEYMVQLNYNSYNKRYNEQGRPTEYKYKETKSPASIWHFIRTLDYFLYQIEEPTVLKVLFEALEKVRTRFVSQWFRTRPEYDRLVWGAN